VFYGQKGELRQRYRAGQEDQLGALGFVVNLIVLWNTRYLDLALNEAHTTGLEIKAEDVARLSPLGNAPIQLHGRYHVTVEEALLRGGARALRIPELNEEAEE